MPSFDPDDLPPDGDSDDPGGGNFNMDAFSQIAGAAYPKVSGFITGLVPFGRFIPQTPSATITSGSNTLTLIAHSLDATGTQQFVAYQNGNQIVVGIEGTDNIDNLLTDAGVWSTGVPSPQFMLDMLQAARFIQTLKDNNPNAQITITGHSLGGAEAQLLGNFMNLPAVGFNAPGAGDLANSAVLTALMNAGGFIPSGYDPTADHPNLVNQNWFIGNDLIHSAGTPFGSQIVITPPTTQSVYHWLDNHGIDTVTSALQNSLTKFSDITGQADTHPVKPAAPTINFDGSLTYKDTVLANVYLPRDPGPAAQITYTVGAGSPAIASIVLADDGQSITAFNVWTETNGVWSGATKYALGATITPPANIQAFAFDALNSSGQVVSLPAGYTFLMSYAGSGTATGTVTTSSVANVTANIPGWFLSLLRESLTGPDAALGTQLLNALTSNQESPTQALQAVLAQAQNTTSVATIAYEFFTGKAPGSAGMDFLMSPTGPNPNNLNSAYYQSFNVQNRYINFAVNLGKFGAGATAFNASYGGLDLAGATSLAYRTLFGTTPSADKVNTILNGAVTLGGQTMTRAQYFASYGGDGVNGIGTKAAMVGWLMATAVTSDLGVYAKANDAFLTDVALNGASYGVDFLTKYETVQSLFPALGSAALSISDALSMSSTLLGQLTNGLDVADTSANLMSHLDALETLLSKGDLASITLTDTAIPTLSLTAAQVAGDLPVIESIVGAYQTGTFNLAVAGAVSAAAAAQLSALGSHLTQAVQVSDSSANVTAKIGALEAMAEASKLGSIAFTDATTPVLTLTSTQLSADAKAFADVTSKFAVQTGDYSFNLDGLTIPGMGQTASKIDVFDLDSTHLTATYVENAAGTGGVLSLSSPFATMKVTLTGVVEPANFTGQATAAGFVFTSDGFGGTFVTHH